MDKLSELGTARGHAERRVALAKRELAEAEAIRAQAAAAYRQYEESEPLVLGATVMVNRDAVGHVEVVREQTSESGEHLYRWKIYENGVVLEYGVLNHKESEGPYVLLHKALGEALKGRF